MQEVKKVKEYVDWLMSVVNKIRLLGVEMSDKMIVEKVLVSLSKRFESKISSLEDSKDLSQISLTELVHALQAQEQRRLMRQDDSNEGAMMAAQKGLNVRCKQFKHIEKVCRNKNAQPPQQAQSVEDQQHSSEPEQLFVASCYSMQTTGDVWLIDSGCTNHMATKLENFVRIDRTYNSKVKVGNGEYVKAKGIGDVAIQTQPGTKIISSVLFVPEIA
ncbi:uncharacterized protein LOC116122439 [Pistacia vera]|uniref:uncharacterized protein LOC116122439 n=1 Tax=Pistacia vera TaxID=55513 RepID=UPI00126368E6|nr:uncharacterized protein LOC116122439 [Pistacia vera]